jgi:hypothetical protein
VHVPATHLARRHRRARILVSVLCHITASLGLAAPAVAQTPSPGPPGATASVGSRWLIGGKGFDPVGTDYGEIKPAQDWYNLDNLAEITALMKSNAFNRHGEGVVELAIGSNGVFIKDGTHRFIVSMRLGPGYEIVGEVVENRVGTSDPYWRHQEGDVPAGGWRDVQGIHDAVKTRQDQPTPTDLKAWSTGSASAHLLNDDVYHVHDNTAGQQHVTDVTALVRVRVPLFIGLPTSVAIDWKDGSRTVIPLSAAQSPGQVYEFDIAHDYDNGFSPGQTYYPAAVEGSLFATATVSVGVAYEYEEC